MRWISWLLVIGACALVAAGLGYFKYSQINAAIERGKAFPERSFAVETYIVESLERQPTLNVTGEVVAQRSAVLQNELQGRIVEVAFQAGQAVAAGQTLLRLDSTQEAAQLQEAMANQDIAKLALDRAQRLVRSGAGAVEAMDQANAQFEAAQARVAALRALIRKQTLSAPFDAIAGLHRLEVGQFLDAGTQITELVGVGDDAWVDFSVPQDYAAVRLGAQVSIRQGQTEMPASVIALDAAINTRSRNRGVRASVNSTAGALLPGMLVQVELPLGAPSRYTVVPATAVRRDAFGVSVYVLEASQVLEQEQVRARKRVIQLSSVRDADQSQDWLVVTDGLAVGERIAGVGAFKLHDGALVIPATPNTAAAERRVGL